MAYQYYRTMTVDHTQVPANQTNFTVLVSVTDTTLKTTGGHVLNASGFDIVFSTTNNGSSLLNWEVESYDPTTGTIIAWVKMSISSSADTVFYMVYSNPSISTFQGGAVGTAWDSATTRVYHLGVGPSMADTSANNTTATNNGVTADTSGKIGSCVRSAGNGTTPQYFDAGDAVIGTAVCMSGWFKFNSLTASPSTLASSAHPTTTNAYYVNSSGKMSAYFTVNSGIHVDPATTALSTGTWYHLSVVYNSTVGLIVYINGVSDGSVGANGDISTPTHHLVIGWDDNSGRYMDGWIDEFKVSNTIRTANWLLTEYRNQNNPTSFVGMGAENTLFVNATATPSGVTAAFLQHAPTASGALNGIALPLGVTAAFLQHSPTGQGSGTVIVVGVTAALLQHAPFGNVIALPNGVTAIFAQHSPISLIFIDSSGAPIANGKMVIRLNADAKSSIGQVCSKNTVFSIDTFGQVDTRAVQLLSALSNNFGDVNAPSYSVTVYNASGELVWGPSIPGNPALPSPLQ